MSSPRLHHPHQNLRQDLLPHPQDRHQFPDPRLTLGPTAVQQLIIRPEPACEAMRKEHWKEKRSTVEISTLINTSWRSWHQTGCLQEVKWMHLTVRCQKKTSHLRPCAKEWPPTKTPDLLVLFCHHEFIFLSLAGSRTAL